MKIFTNMLSKYLIIVHKRENKVMKLVASYS